MNGNQDKKSGFFSKVLTAITKCFKTLGTWIARMFMGSSKSLAKNDIFEAERLESPSKLAVKEFLVHSAFCQELIMSPLLHDLAVFHENDKISISVS